VSDREHRRQIEVALASAVKRGIVVTIPRRGSRLRYFARPIVVEPEREIIVDEIVPPPKPMRKLAPPAPKPRPGRPRKPDVVAQLPAVVVPEPPPRQPELSIRYAVIADLMHSPNAFTLWTWLRIKHPDDKGSFDLKMFDVASKLGWAVPRVVAALTELMRRDYIYARGQFLLHSSLDGPYSWYASRHAWRHLTKAEREALHVAI
jgi:hypothetical protein